MSRECDDQLPGRRYVSIVFTSNDLWTRTSTRGRLGQCVRGFATPCGCRHRPAVLQRDRVAVVLVHLRQDRDRVRVKRKLGRRQESQCMQLPPPQAPRQCR